MISPTGEQLGIRPLPEALALAKEQDLDLVEVADKANPPVCRIMNYSKYKYEQGQKAKESRRKSSNTSVKEMKYRPKIGQGDFDTKTRKVEEFLSEGHKVKVTIMFRGREMQHPELGRHILDRVIETVSHVALVEAYPKQDGRNMVMVLGPDKKAQAVKKRRGRDPIPPQRANILWWKNRQSQLRLQLHRLPADRIAECDHRPSADRRHKFDRPAASFARSETTLSIAKPPTTTGASRTEAQSGCAMPYRR